MRNIFGCKFIYEDTKRIERYSGFLFEEGSASLTSAGQDKLNKLITQIQPYGWDKLKFDILGNVEDEDMSEKQLLQLSKQRAETIKTKLTQAGANIALITLHSKADKAPMFSNESDDSIELNNRADIIVRKLKK
jgi:adhesin transport system outer membrane protein